MITEGVEPYGLHKTRSWSHQLANSSTFYVWNFVVRGSDPHIIRSRVLMSPGMSLIVKLLKYTILINAFIGVLFSMSVLSVVPVLLLRYLLLPDDLLTIPVDFVTKSVKRSLSGSAPEPQLVAYVDLTSIPDFSHSDYAIDLQLSLPRSESNLQLGNFVIRGTLSAYNWRRPDKFDTAHGDTVEKMGILPFKSPTIERMSRLVFSPWYIFGLMKEESKLDISMWRNTNRPKYNSPHLLLTLPEQLMVSKAELIFKVNLRGLRWLLRAYPISTTMMGSSIVFIFEFTSTGSFILLLYRKITTQKPPKPRYNAYSAKIRPIIPVRRTSTSPEKSHNGSTTFIGDTTATEPVGSPEVDIPKFPTEESNNSPENGSQRYNSMVIPTRHTRSDDSDTFLDTSILYEPPGYLTPAYDYSKEEFLDKI